ncbi:response regulator [Endozoicomonas sp.]|uniref:response regulator n=1 Tax=Endozoicomonas sp. TaxID=1892382 RepID=UPI0028854CD6|nr:response regulator [Endozoicomonas sp.]
MDFTGKKILIAEDNMANQFVIRQLFKKVNIAPVFAKNGKEAIELYKSNYSEWDLVFMDCKMPLVDGYQATESIRQFEQENGLKKGIIVGLSANAVCGSTNEALASGMDDYLTKPIEREKIMQILSQYLQ